MKTKREYKEKYLQYHKKAEDGHADSQFKLGEIYEQGKGVTKDCKLAEFWYLKAAQQKHAMALLNLSWMRLKELGIDPNEGHFQNRFTYPRLK